MGIRSLGIWVSRRFWRSLNSVDRPTQIPRSCPCRISPQPKKLGVRVQSFTLSGGTLIYSIRKFIHIHIPSKSFKKLRHIILVPVSSPSIYFFGQNLTERFPILAEKPWNKVIWMLNLNHDTSQKVHSQPTKSSISVKNADSTPGNQDFPGMNHNEIQNSQQNHSSKNPKIHESPAFHFQVFHPSLAKNVGSQHGLW